MAVSYIKPAGGLPSAAKALLVPENIRAGVHIKGGGVDVVGAVIDMDNLEILACTYFMYEQGRYGTRFQYWTGNSYALSSGSTRGTFTFSGTPKVMVVVNNQYIPTACGISRPNGIYTKGLSSNAVTWGDFYDWTAGCLIILGEK